MIHICLLQHIFEYFILALSVHSFISRKWRLFICITKAPSGECESDKSDNHSKGGSTGQMHRLLHSSPGAPRSTTVCFIWITRSLNQLFYWMGATLPGGDTRPKLGYNARHKFNIWTLRDITTSEKGCLKDLHVKRVFGKFEIGGLKDLNRVIDANCLALDAVIWVKLGFSHNAIGPPHLTAF